MRASSILLLLLLASCYRVVENGGETSIVFSRTVHGVAVLLPLLALYGAFRFWSRPRGRAVSVVLCVFALSMSFATWTVFAARILITPTEIYDWRGFPWDRTKRGFAFADVARVDTTAERSGYGRSSRSVRVWHLRLKNGGTARLEMGDLWEHAEREIFERLARHGIARGPDPKELGFASDDPFVVTFGRTEYRLDSGSAKERLSGLVLGGHIGRMLAEDGSGDLDSAGKSGRSLTGVWKRRLGTGPRTLDLDLRFERKGTFVFEVSSGERTQRSEGKYRMRNGALTLEQDGASLDVIF